MNIKKFCKKISEICSQKDDNKEEKIENAVKRGVKEYEETFKRLAQT